MKPTFKAALVMGFVSIVASTSSAFAQMDGPPPPDGPLQGIAHREGGRLGDRLLAEYDLNHDGKITHTEYNTIIANRYAKAVHGGKGLTLAEFTALHMPEFQKHTAEMFRRIDWKGDGKITLEEYAAPQRARFEVMDHDGSGAVSCAPARGQANAGVDYGNDNAASSRGRGGSGRGAGGFGLARFCRDNDLNEDGKVTRQELDQAIAKRFSSATKGKLVMTEQEFYAEELASFTDMNTRMFKRLDRERNGVLTLQEYAAPEEKLFARLDRNNDGVLTPDELQSRGVRRAGSTRLARR
jgi:Ca2+-binding EF-hand superfamily protein